MHRSPPGSGAAVLGTPLVIFLAAMPAIARAAEAGSSGGMWFTGLIMTLAALAMIAIAWALRSGMPVGGQSGPLRVLAVQMIGPRERVVVIQIAGRTLVLGQTTSQVSLLCELNDEEASQIAQPAGPVISEFSGKLQAWLKRGRS